MIKFSITPNGHMVEVAARWTQPSDPVQTGTDNEVAELQEVLNRYHPEWHKASPLPLPANLGRIALQQGVDRLTYTTPLHSEADAKLGPCRAFVDLSTAASLCVVFSRL